MTYIDQLQERFPVRKTRAQKQAFRDFALEEAQRLGYDARVEQSAMGSNVVIGNPDGARVIFTAHYDTPPTMPVPNFITPCNVGVYLLYQVGLVLGLLAISAAAGAAAGLLGCSPPLRAIICMAVYFGALALMVFGPANPHNANDNTSGVAAVLEAMALVPPQAREHAAFVLFDNEEKGMLGSGSFAGRHKRAAKEALLVNMDCVGAGDSILVIAPKRAREHALYGALTRALLPEGGKEVVWRRKEGCMYPSDQANFRCCVAVCACRQGRRIGYYCDKIHTRHDTRADGANIALIAKGLAALACGLQGE